MTPYALMVALFASFALLVALGNSLARLELIPWINGLVWLRVHLITLGILMEALFGVLPALVAAGVGAPRPRTRWDIWLSLNAGLLVLMVGIPLIHQTLILVGGALVLLAALLLLGQLVNLPARGAGAGGAREWTAPAGLRFYAMGVVYLLLGVTVGTGLWLGWDTAVLRIATPREVHVHANGFGFMALVFAGLLVDLAPDLTGRPLAGPRALWGIFVLMTLGAFGLVLGPWLNLRPLIVVGLLLHLVATLWLLARLVGAGWRAPGGWSPGRLHLVSAYVWFLAPLLVSPPAMFGAPGFSEARIEASAPPTLIYGWMLQFGYATLPYLVSRMLRPDLAPRLGGTWLSLVAIHLGAALQWASVFVPAAEAQLQAAAFACWALSAAPVLAQLFGLVRAGLERGEAMGDRVEMVVERIDVVVE